MINVIRVCVSYYENPTEEQLENYSDRIVAAVDDYCNNRQRSFIINRPSEERIKAKAYNYEWEIEVGDCSVNAHDLFDIVNPLSLGGKVLLVDVRDKKYDPKYNNCNVGYYWTNEGSTWFHDSKEGYVDPYYDFHINGNVAYTIIHIPSYASRHEYSFRGEDFEKSGQTYMWRCTTSYDNFMKATTLEDAIEEFEQLYKDKLWETLKARTRSLNDALDNCTSFNAYLESKKG